MFILSTPFRRYVLFTYIAIVAVFVAVGELEPALGHPVIYEIPIAFIAPAVAWLFMFIVGLVRFRLQAFWLLLAAPVAGFPLLFPCSFMPCDSF